MSSLQWLLQYNANLYNNIVSIMGDQPPSHYDDITVSLLANLGVPGFYFNYIDATNPNAPDWLPDNHRLATMVVAGTTTKASTHITARIYETALNQVTSNGKMHTILYFKDNNVELQSMLSLGRLNQHAAMGTQVIIGAPVKGLLEPVVDFVIKFTGRNDIFQLKTGTWNDGLKAISTHLETQSFPNP